jgi:hypothetical protein
MNLSDRVKEADERIRNTFRTTVVSNYEPLFDDLTTLANGAMDAIGAEVIDLSPQGVKYNGRGFVKGGGNTGIGGEILGISDLPRVYIEHSRYIAGQADSRHNIDPDYHAAMKNAFEDFREKIRSTLASRAD